MHLLLSATVACWGLGLFAQGFNKRYDAFGQNNLQDGWDIEPNLGGYLTIGGSYEPDTLTDGSLVGSYTAILTQIDLNGQVLWQRRTKVPWYAVYLGWTNCCDTIPGGGIVAGGTIEDTSHTFSARLVRYTTSADTLWTHSFGSPGHFWIGAQVSKVADGGYAICGYTDATGYQDGFVIRTDSAGNEQWRETYGWSPPTYIDGFAAIAESPHGDLYTSGSRWLSIDDSQHWVQRTDALGQLHWRASWGDEFEEGATSLTMLSSGYPLVIGGNTYDIDGHRRAYLAVLDTVDGSFVWEKEYSGSGQRAIFFAAKECPEGSLIAAGGSFENNDQHGLLLHATAQGDSLWMRAYLYVDSIEEGSEGRFHDVLPTGDGGFIAAGYAYSTQNYSQDAWVVKVDSLGCIVPGCDGTGVTELVTNLLGAITLSPNPAHGEVQVRLDLPANLKHEALDLSIVGMDGRVMRRMAWLGNGKNTMRVVVRDLSAGLYTLHITDGTKWITGTKLIIE